MSNDLNRLMSDHFELRQLLKTDADFYAWYQMCLKKHCTVEEFLVGSVVYMARSKQQYFDQLINMKQPYYGGPSKVMYNEASSSH